MDTSARLRFTGYSPSVYGYSYLLSPAQTRVDFGTLDVCVLAIYKTDPSDKSIAG